MTNRKRKEKTGTKLEAGMLGLTDVNVLPERAVLEKYPISGYKYRYTTGPFLLPQNSGSLDWSLLNNDTTQQKARVTVFKCPVGTVKTPVAPGAIVVTLDPGESTHNERIPGRFCLRGSGRMQQSTRFPICFCMAGKLWCSYPRYRY